jgi:hypothetical protein
MTLTSSCDSLLIKFNQDIDNVAKTLVGAFGLKHEREVTGLEEPLLRWLDFRLRHIDPCPRQIFVSDKFPKTLPKNIADALHDIEKKIIDGEDINPYQGKGLILHNDTSGTKRQNRTDLLWADWGIHHIHLTDQPIESGNYFSKRSDFLLFLIVGHDFVLFIDIRSHDEDDVFCRDELIKIIAAKWPDYMERFEMKGILAPTESTSEKDRAVLRKGGVSGMLVINGKCYIGPGLGITTASTSTKVSLMLNNVHHDIRALSQLVCDPSSQFQESKSENPEFSLALTARGLAVFEEKSNQAWVLPERKDGEQESSLTRLRNLLTPTWVVNRLNNSTGTSP